MSMKSFSAQQRLDSRGKPTVQVQLVCTHGTFRAIVPSGATKGDYESVELRDDDPKAYNGQGVSKAISNVNHILGPAIIKQNFDLTRDQRRIDEYMIQLDGSDDKHNLGANAILGISMAVARAAAAAKGVPLYEFLAEVSGRRSPGDKWSMPIPFMNVLNGGGHSGNALAFQEFMIAPFGAEFFAQAVQWNAETYVALKKHGKAAIRLGDEGGFAPPCKHPKEALDLLVAAIKAAGHEGKIKIGVDAAAESFRTKDGMYDMGYKAAEQELVDTHDMTELYQELLTKFPILLLEDPFGQDDWAAFAELTKQCKVELVGDDLLATNMKRINTAEEKKACNSLLLKINQIGTISEAIDAANEAFRNGWLVFVSHRSGETTDDFIADLTVGINAGHLKSGACARGERVAKYNRLLDVEDELGGKARQVTALSSHRDLPRYRVAVEST